MKGRWKTKRTLTLRLTEEEVVKLHRELSQLRGVAHERLPAGTQHTAVDEFIGTLGSGRHEGVHL